MEILDIFSEHCNLLTQKINKKSENEIVKFIETVVKFYFNFNFENVIKKHIFIDINKKTFLEDLQTDNLSFYRVSTQKVLDEIDEYDDEPEEIDELELLLLNAWDYMLIENKKEALFGLFEQIINILDYYEQFSERLKYWNAILEKELSNQLELLNQNKIDLNYYMTKYNGIEFDQI